VCLLVGRALSSAQGNDTRVANVFGTQKSKNIVEHYSGSLLLFCTYILDKSLNSLSFT
jgi:hypothetical protein